MNAPFSVLMVCMGNICRSPMAEVLLRLRLEQAVGGGGGDLVRVHSAGTGFWHAGDGMNPPAAAEVRARGGDPTAFRARGLEPAYLKESDLVLTATIEQIEHVADLVPDAAGRTFVLGEFARLAPEVDAATLPAVGASVEAVAARGRALVAAVDAVRDGRRARRDDEVPDPYGRSAATFTAVADQIEDAVRALADLLAPPTPRLSASTPQWASGGVRAPGRRS